MIKIKRKKIITNKKITNAKNIYKNNHIFNKSILNIYNKLVFTKNYNKYKIFILN